MLHDLRLAARTLLRTPGFSIAAALTIAIGVGANATIFGIVDAVLLRALPFRDEARIVALYDVTNDGNATMPLSPANFRDWQARARGFEGMGAWTGGAMTLEGQGEPERITIARTTGNLPQLLGAPLALGRAYAAEHEREGNGAVILLGHALWQRRFGADSGVVGREIRLDGRSFTVLGVLAPQVRWPESATEAWVPLSMPEGWWTNNRGGHGLGGVARLAPGTTVEQASREIARVAREVNEENRPMHDGWSARAVAVREATVGSARAVLLVLAGAVGFVLLLGCANVANLALVRASARQREAAVRAALGARAGHLLRMHLAESVVLGAAGGGLGVVLAGAAMAAIPAIAPAQILRLDTARVDWRVAAFALVLGVLATFVSAAWPALAAARGGVAGRIREGGRSSTAGAARARTRDLLFVAEVALALVLLAGAGMATRGLASLLEQEPGFRPERVLTAAIALPGGRYGGDTAQAQFADRALAALRQAPGVRGAAIADALPLSGDGGFYAFWLPGDAESARRMADRAYVSEGYFDAMGIPLLRGRDFAAADVRGAAGVAVVSAGLARSTFGADDPVGKRVKPYGTDGPEFEVVGVVGDTRQASLGEAARAQLYLSVRQAPQRNFAIVARGTGEPASLASSVRAAIRGIDPALAVDDVRGMEDVIAGSVARPRFAALLLGSFALCALLLAIVGIYGVVSSGVAQRRGEFGIRAALGAMPAQQMRDVVGAALRRAGVGVAVGLAGVMALSRVVAAELPGTRATDPALLAGVAATMTLVALVASWLPARRAMRASPLSALRSE